MNKELKQKWIDALRSGKYEQGYGILKTYNNYYCCLGVLAEISGDLITSKNDKDCFGVFNADNPNSISVCILPNNMYGLSTEIKKFLMNLNDHKKLTFSEIADQIEKEDNI